MKYLNKYGFVILIVFGFSMFIKPAVCSLILGLLLCYMSTEYILFLKKVHRKGIESIGRILFFESDSDGHKTPMIEFTTIEGETILDKPFLYVSTDLSTIRSYKNRNGKEVSIIYDPEDPKKFIIVGETSYNYIGIAISILVGLFFIVLSICGF